MLNADYKEISDFHNTCYITDDDGNHELNPITFALVMGTMHTGIREITAKNAVDVFARFDLIQKIFGAFVRSSDGDYYITPEDVYRHIGLKTNASTYTEAQFFTHIRKDVFPDLKMRYTQSIRLMEEGANV